MNEARAMAIPLAVNRASRRSTTPTGSMPTTEAALPEVMAYTKAM